MNLFSVFDPTVGMFSLSLNWLSGFLGFVVIPLIYWFMPSRMFALWWLIVDALHREFKILVGVKGSVGGGLLFVGLFSYILFNNFMGLFPYVFTSTSHLAVTLSLALPLWLSLMMYGWFNHSQHMFTHLVPEGTPFVLMFFMVMIETVSNLIRPGTLAVRLAANMIAGHLLMVLLSNMGLSLSMIMVGGLLVVQLILLSLEFAVSMIQSYVFVVLSVLYSSEVN